MSKLRVLCLHGFTSNGSVHAHQVRSITKALSANFDFIFPDGPHEVEITEKMKRESPTMRSWSEFVAEKSSSGHRAWWFARDADPAGNEPGGFHGLERSLDYLGDIIEKTGPVHAIWGFSQGACFAAMLMALLSNRQKDHPLRNRLPSIQTPPSAGIFFSGFKARFSQYDSAYTFGIDDPTLHVIGTEDKAVTPERSETLMKICKDASVLKHSGGHDIPGSVEDREAIVNFLQDNVRLVNSDKRGNM